MQTASSTSFSLVTVYLDPNSRFGTVWPFGVDVPLKFDITHSLQKYSTGDDSCFEGVPHAAGEASTVMLIPSLQESSRPSSDVMDPVRRNSSKCAGAERMDSPKDSRAFPMFEGVSGMRTRNIPHQHDPH